VRKFGKILLTSLLILAGFVAFGLLYSINPRIRHQIVYFDSLPSHLEGLRILHISDLHSDNVEVMNINIWDLIDNLEFDIAVITGDIVLDGAWRRAEPILELDPHKPYLRNLANRVPTFFVEGNHETAHLQRFMGIMDELGITFLYNQRHFLELPNRGILEIIGVQDYSSMRRSGFGAMETLFEEENAGFRLVLSHQPQIFDRIKHTGSMMVFAGHTHGGQIRIPFVPTIYAPGQGFFPAYGRGLYQYNDAHMYVSSGIGTTYFPWRFFNPPEVVIIELRHK